MGMRGGGRSRLPRYGLLSLCAALLLAGCTSMPSSGEVSKVGDGSRADSDSQVRVIPIPPSTGESAMDIVRGFQDAITSSDPDFATARKYLAKGVKWNPGSGITVFSAAQQDYQEDDTTGRKEGWVTVSLSSTKVATVDAKHAYEPSQGPFQAPFHLTRQGNEWRIDSLPQGLVMSQVDFQRVFHTVNMYYFARLAPKSDGMGTRPGPLVADPVYLPDAPDSLKSTVSALLGGPSDWLDPVVTNAAPMGAQLDEDAPDNGVTLDDSQRLKVRLDASGDDLRGRRCTELAAQLFTTVQAQSVPTLASAEVDRKDGSPACVLRGDAASAYSPGRLVGSAGRQFFIAVGGDQNLLETSGDDPRATPVAGPLGGRKAGLESVAVRRDGDAAAGVRNQGRDLVVGSLIADGAFGAPVVTSQAADPKNRLSAPSWDGAGDLWVADRDPANPRLLVLHSGVGQPIVVSVPGLEGRVQSLRVASDGVRIALVVQQGAVSRLQLGRIVREDVGNRPAFSVTGLRPLTPPEENVTSVSWAGPSRLVVLGTESGGAQQIEYVSTDGSTGSALQGVSEATSVAASEKPNTPLLASYDKRVYRLPPTDNNWKQLSPEGSDPVYPG